MTPEAPAPPSEEDVERVAIEIWAQIVLEEDTDERPATWVDEHPDHQATMRRAARAAIAAWNRRPAPTTSEEDVERMARAGKMASLKARSATSERIAKLQRDIGRLRLALQLVAPHINDPVGLFAKGCAEVLEETKSHE